MIYYFSHIIFFLLFVYLAINILYLLFMAVAGKVTSKAPALPGNARRNRIAVLIPSFNEDDVIVRTAKKAAGHDYPKTLFDVYIAADRTRPETIAELNKLDVTVYSVDFVNSSKARSLNFLLNTVDESNYDIALIIDGDNIMTSGFLDKVSVAFNMGFRAVQGHRTAKNLDTPVAVLDALSEEINNHFFRQAQRAAGFTSALIGSGMAFEFSELKRIYNKEGILDNPACDREVDFEMLKNDITIQYLPDAILLDEKVSKQSVFLRQRRRWFESQIIHIKYFFDSKQQVKRKGRNYWNKLFLTLMPPRSMLLVMFLFVFGILVLEQMLEISIIGISYQLWTALLLLYLIALVMAIPFAFYTMRTLRAILHLPLLLVSWIFAIAGIKPRRKEFVHTPKSYKSDDSE